jgi:hypothetical protein
MANEPKVSIIKITTGPIIYTKPSIKSIRILTDKDIKNVICQGQLYAGRIT